MLDFHTHILPGIDDGSSSVGQSIQMIEMLLEQGVKSILLTPHFYAYRSSTGKFIDERKAAVKKLASAVEEKGLDVSLYVGCELLYFDEIWRIENLESFCIKGTNYILVEMPFCSWDNSLVKNVSYILNRGYIPILAHFERYLNYKGNPRKIHTLIAKGVLLQMNCSYLNRVSTRRKAVKMIKKGSVVALGTDCHNLERRKPNYEQAVEVLRKKLSTAQFEKFVAKQKRLIKDAVKVYPTDK